MLAAASAAPAVAQTNDTAQTVAEAKHEVEVRDACIGSRRRICGRIIKVLPDGLIVDSGYTNAALNGKSWLIPGAVSAEKAANAIEERKAGCVCIGVVCLTDIPKLAGAAPRPSDFVNIEAYPLGDCAYVSVGEVRHTVRRFSAKLLTSVEWALARERARRAESGTNS